MTGEGRTRGRLALCSIVPAILLAACSTTPPPAVGPAAADPVIALGQGGYSSFAPALYRLRATDKISVIVYREPDLSLEEVAIGLDGQVGLPLLGSVTAAGMTATELAADVQGRLRAAARATPSTVSDRLP